uniref:Uncharacterized protein n=1 Tax=Anopheles minimus TaxID=112268 RepID=A0A182W3N9_9DIPT
MWLNGPPFLYDDAKCWPQQELPPINTADELRVNLLIHDVTVPCLLIDANRISKRNVLVRTMACVFRFINNCKKKTKGEPLEMLRATGEQQKLLLPLNVVKKSFTILILQQHEYEKAERVLWKMA